jgi:hypothetical protein
MKMSLRLCASASLRLCGKKLFSSQLLRVAFAISQDLKGGGVGKSLTQKRAPGNQLPL